MNRRLYKLMVRSFDAPLSKQERIELDAGLASSEELRKSRQEIERVRAALHSPDRALFKPFFAERVQLRLSTPQQSIADCFVSIFRTVAVGASVLFILCASYNLSRGSAFSFESALGIHRPTIAQALALEVPFE